MLNDEDLIKLKSVLLTKEDLKEIKSDNLVLKNDLSEVKNDVLELKGEMNLIKTDLTEVKNDVLGLKGEISFIKSDLTEVKSDMADLKELIQGLIIPTDSISKAIGNLSIEYSAISNQLSRHELWIKQIAEKVGLKLATD